MIKLECPCGAEIIVKDGKLMNCKECDKKFILSIEAIGKLLRQETELLIGVK